MIATDVRVIMKNVFCPENVRNKIYIVVVSSFTARNLHSSVFTLTKVVVNMNNMKITT